MDIFTTIITVIGLCVFEIISSVDNAIINAGVLSTMQEKSRKWFLFLGMFFAVFIIRGMLPWLIIWLSTPNLSPLQAFTSAFSANANILESIEKSSPILLIAASTFLLFLFFHWLFIEPKKFLLKGEKFFQSHFYLFYAVVSVILLAIVWFAVHINPLMAFGAVFGATSFYVVEAIRNLAEEKKRKINRKNYSDASKIVYLEVLDSTFSIDGVVGAFAFTLSVPLILIGNGIGALAVRHFTIKNLKIINKYKYLKKGAMYSIFFLGLIMLLNSFGVKFPSWLPPLITVLVVGYFFHLSKVPEKNSLKH